MTDEQKQRIADLLGEIQTILNASGINDEVYINCRRIPTTHIGYAGLPAYQGRPVYEVQMEVMRNEIVRAKAG